MNKPGRAVLSRYKGACGPLTPDVSSMKSDSECQQQAIVPRHTEATACCMMPSFPHRLYHF